jgi:CBS domain-containing protein
VDVELNLNTDTVMHAHPQGVLAVTPDVSIREVLEKFESQDEGSVVVCEGDRVVGIFTERDALRVMADSSSLESGSLDRPIRDVMVSPPVTAFQGETVATAVRRMSAGGFRRLPVVDAEGRPLGVLKVSGILHYLVECFPKTVYNLPPKPRAVPQERDGA